MKFEQDLYLEQQQKLLMTPELRQAIAILQMSVQELKDFVQQQIVENPLLEEKEAVCDESDEVPAAPSPKVEDWGEFLDGRESGEVYGESADSGEEVYPERLPSLYEHLYFQWHMISGDPEVTAIGDYLIGNLDTAGYLALSVEEVAQRMNAVPERVATVLEQIQTLHPHGVGARDLTECLLIQLEHYGRDDAVNRQLAEHHLTDIARGRMNQLAGILKVGVRELQERCDFIRSLDPKPGLQYSNDDAVKYIIPDVIVEKIAGEYIVTLNEAGFSGLVLNRMYKDMLRSPEAFNAETRQYLEEKANAAVWVIRSIDQRRDTLYKVARCIVDLQRDFLDYGPRRMRPLTLKRVAEAVGMHESTISRVTANKYMQTPRGVLELKYFFSSEVSVDPEGMEEALSSRSVKDAIRRLIATEPPSSPLSDQNIVDKLAADGINISRRTVAKYRNEMDIPVAAARKRY
ncbi:MAG: RNA polymerase factor sigma-54 [Syntrophomonadaceae bacterium]|nr:RNA polymerase factor sigma-54 [Syntrophomonadaceae bacterium]